MPFFFAVYGILKAALPHDTALSLGYLVFYCLELVFFAFGFLFKGFKIPKMHGNKIFIPLGIGAVAAIAVIISFIINR